MSSAQSPIAAGSAPALRQFLFFDVAPVQDVRDSANPPEIFKTTPEISTTAPSSSGVLIADIHGSIHMLNSDFEINTSWVAYAGGRATHMIERGSILLTLGEDDTVRSPLLKMWDLQKIDKKTAAPLLLRSTKIQAGNRPHPVTCVALSATLSYLAIGLADGTVLFFRHLDQSLSSSNSLTAIPKARTIHESPTEPITGLGFKEPSEDSHNLYLFIVTTNRVLSYQGSGKGHGGPAVVVDEVGCALNCAVMDWRAKDVVVARDEALYICGVDGRGPCLAYEGHKSSIHTHLNYIIIVSPPFLPSASAASATVRNFVARSANSLDSDIAKVTVIDLENKLVAYSGTFNDGVREVISQWGNIYILSNDGKLYCLHEKPTSEKLNMLYQRSFYVLALNIASTQKLDDASVADIRRQYGDHLYSIADYDSAMQQYMQTIGHIQPSYVIRKFLDAQRIHNLVTYLQELHSLGLANTDHTTLLLNTYTKLKDVTRLDNFIKMESRRTTINANGEETEELPFDLETAIRVCRQAGYFDHASYLAQKYGRHEDYLRIQIEDARNYKTALTYLRKLGVDAAESNLARYGRAMLESLPEETTQLLIDLCTDARLLADEQSSSHPSTKQSSSGPSYLSYLALNRTSMAAPTITSSDAATIAAPSIKTVTQENTTRRDSVHEASPSTSLAPAAEITPLPPPVKRLSPRLYFAHFVDHLDYFVVFLETVAFRRWGQTVDEQLLETPPPKLAETIADEEVDQQDQVAVWNTLLELYLTLPLSTPRGESSTKLDESVLRKKALRLLGQETIPYNPMHALILCSSKEYTEGLVLLWEKMAMHDDILRFWMDQYKTGKSPDAALHVVSCLNKYGGTRPHLYPLVLRFLASSPELLGRHQDDVKKIVQHIDENGILPVLGIIQALSWNGVASVGLIKDWLMQKIKQSREDISNDEEFTKSHRLETAEKTRQVNLLSDPDQPKVFHVTRCSSCGGQLDLPSLHFMCDHSYHQRCVIGHETECPTCARQYGVIREIRRNNERLADQHDLFLSEVVDGGFAAVASAFGRDILNMPKTGTTTIP